MIRGALMPFALGIAIALVAFGSYFGLEALLASYADHDRGLCEGATFATVMTVGNAIANGALRHRDARKEIA